MSARATRPCPECGTLVPDVDGPVHAYVPAAPGCWELFGRIQADEAVRLGYAAAHRLVVDAYLAQHPGDGRDRRLRQSVFVHLVGLCAALELDLPARRVADVSRRLVREHDDFPRLERSGAGEPTLLHVVGAADAAEYEERARAWAGAVWATWAAHYDAVRSALASALPG